MCVCMYACLSTYVTIRHDHGSWVVRVSRQDLGFGITGFSPLSLNSSVNSTLATNAEKLNPTVFMTSNAGNHNFTLNSNTFTCSRVQGCQSYVMTTAGRQP